MLGVIFLFGAVPLAIFSLPMLAKSFGTLALIALGLTLAISAMAYNALAPGSGSALADATAATVSMGFMLAAVLGTITRAIALLARRGGWRWISSPWIETAGALLVLIPLFALLFSGDF